MYLPYLYMAMMPLGLEFGDDCLDFINSTVCFLTTIPYIMPPMAVIEPIQTAHIESCQHGAPWHLPALINPDLKKLDYPYDGTGSEVDVYILDTWVDCDHSQFDGRCRELTRFASHSPTARPPHGTHVAGIVGSTKFGAAKRASIRSIVVLDDQGFGGYDDFIKALHFAMRQILGRKRRSIINMSLRGGKSRILDSVVDEIQVNNVAVMTVAAGNQNEDACQGSPMSPNIAVAGSTNVDRKMSDFSNYGKCVTILAPGESIASTCPDQHECWMSGTSMASPLTAGAIATFWDQYPKLKPQEIWRKFKEESLKGKIKIKGGTPNMFVHLEPKARCLFNSDGLLVDDLLTGSLVLE